ncbi:hypothetical protein CQW23_24052 [Capsicum baccatum]|uniref:Pentatricopeptide repeat-containing protein n=1 Tax=Capsicum baccatum TaxID=33114 RepID=A0A2G2VTR3_CAPBA|nr:hypothetical protein CQW23_24052 [Capsicum baccatum]
MRSPGSATVLTCNIMEKLYVKTGNLDKLHSLVQGMDAKEIYVDAFTYAIWLNADVCIVDIKEMEKLVMKVEEYPLLIDMEWFCNCRRSIHESWCCRKCFCGIDKMQALK